jgi:lipopolysaccharide/colanic/teichoic acid biosynthesis glycosyltransferase
MALLESLDEPAARSQYPGKTGMRTALAEEAFRRTLAIERKRTERSGNPFLLMIFDVGRCRSVEATNKALDNMLSLLLSTTRDTDIVGWYKEGSTVAGIFTGLGADEKNIALSVILARISNSFRELLTAEQLSQVNISFHFFPDDWDHDASGRPSDETLYPDLTSGNNARRPSHVVKRAMDIIGSALAILICSPVLLVIAVAIKVSSKGPILFKQQRVGQHGQCFTFLKFRSMYVDNDPSAHKEYVTKLIAGQAKCETANGESLYKLVNDRRVTRVGKFLRKSSLDEIPQFFNVFRGDMALVGPRPAIPYEVATYQIWHRRRVLDVKPGITGLWQVSGRNRIKFDDMVRLDLQYATSWSPWLDFKILLLTPQAVLRGAY